MAFDRPLEADRVDDGDLFSAFVRAPVVGPFVWMLGGGGDRRKDDDNDEDDKVLSTTSERVDDNREKSCRSENELNNSTGKKRLPFKSSLQKKPPSLVVSDVSSIGESLGSLEVIDTTATPVASPFRRKKKELSWSDESGHSLVEVFGQTKTDSSVRLSDNTELLVNATPTLPRTNSMRRRMENNNPVLDDGTRLIQGPMTPVSRPEQELRYLPRGLDKAHDGIIMPRAPMTSYRRENSTSSSVSMDGGESPQWGWFMRTTPPSPQMYHSAAAAHYHHSTSDPYYSSRDVVPGSQPNAVFQRLQDNNRNKPIGWSGVPL